MKVLFIGRGSNADIALVSDTVSKEHAQLIISENSIEIIDLNSTNGTYVNGKQIAGKRVLKKGDVVVLGGELLVWELYLPETEESIEVTNTFKPAQKNKGMMYAKIAIVAVLVIGLISIVLFTRDNSDKKSDSNLTVQEAFPTVEPGEVEYDFSCLNTDADSTANEIITTLSDWEQGFFEAFGEEVTIQEETDCGLQVKDDMTTNNYGNNYARISTILGRLVTAIPNKKGYKYEIHLVNEDVVNAFTCGGQIFIYQGMIDFCKSNDELASIIAHEIAHNELGHIKHKLSQIKTSNEWLGDDWGEFTAALYMNATVSFGQKQETHCDLYGIDLAIKAGFKACDTDQIWKRMEDSEYSIEGSILRSHPYSAQRASCCRNHVNAHHLNSCK